MTTNARGLPPELIFEPDGHVSDVCVTCVSDGEVALVPQAALDHLDACDACGQKLGEAALRTLAVHEALGEAPLAAAIAAPAPSIAPVSPRRSRRPMPIAAIAVALLIAAITAGPAIADAIAAVPKLVVVAVGWAPTLLRVVAAVVWSGSSVGPWAIAFKAVSAGMFVLAGLSVARVTSRRRAAMVEGGVR